MDYLVYSHSDELMHFGIKGMRWGVRRFQNPDGTRTAAGRKRYRDKPAFMSKRKYKKQLKAQAAKQEQRKSIHDMSDEELDAAITRIRKERTLEELMRDPNVQERGRSKVKEMLKETSLKLIKDAAYKAGMGYVDKFLKDRDPDVKLDRASKRLNLEEKRHNLNKSRHDFERSKSREKFNDEREQFNLDRDKHNLSKDQYNYERDKAREPFDRQKERLKYNQDRLKYFKDLDSYTNSGKSGGEKPEEHSRRRNGRDAGRPAGLRSLRRAEGDRGGDRRKIHRGAVPLPLRAGSQRPGQSRGPAESAGRVPEGLDARL